jgi:hypothetical protein
MKLYHRTTKRNSEAILREGFKDVTGYYLTDCLHNGVWLSNVPLDCNEGAKCDDLLEVELDAKESDLSEYEWAEEGKSHREWLIPAVFVNGKGKVRLVEDESEIP